MNYEILIPLLALVIPLLVLVIGWFVNNELNRRHEIFKKRIDCRLDLLNKFISFSAKAFKTKTIGDEFNKIQVLFFLYGYDDEKKLVKEVTDACINENDDAIQKLVELNNLMCNKLRKELRLKSKSKIQHLKQCFGF